ncbi:MAG: hypothetical protein IK123_03060 [Lachnospiraceae bacterium]|nr:hypothetical protein [Lachnospiraceae bacterium]
MKMLRFGNTVNKWIKIPLIIMLVLVCVLQGCKSAGERSNTQEIQTQDAEDKADDIQAATEEPDNTPKEQPPVQEETADNTMLNVEAEDAIAYSSIPNGEEPNVEIEEVQDKEDKILRTEDGKIIVDLIMFMGQSNMSGTGGNAQYAPKVPEGYGYEFRAISDPTRLYPIEEPFGINENVPGAISDLPIAKKGSMVSAFVNRYYELTGVPVVAVSASSGGRDTAFWMSDAVEDDFAERQKRAQVWLESNNYYIRKQYVIWLQGESDAEDGLTPELYNQNMDNIIRFLFVGGLQKVFIVTPGRTLTGKYFFDNIVYSQINMCRTSGYYALATTVLCSVSTEYMVDEYHYNQSVLNVVGREAAESAAYYTLNTKEKCLYNYRDNDVYIPEMFEYTEEEMKVEPIDYNNNGELVRY